MSPKRQLVAELGGYASLIVAGFLVALPLGFALLGVGLAWVGNARFGRG